MTLNALQNTISKSKSEPTTDTKWKLFSDQ
jgi:hypothetical protein